MSIHRAHSDRSRRSRSVHAAGFTLIELLVVISIISLLMAILLPALKQARQVAQMSQNLSNLRQVQIALYGYATDNDDRLPFGNTAAGTRWGQTLVNGDYLPDKNLFWSPLRDRDAIKNTSFSGYSVNGRGAMPDEGSGYLPRRMSVKLPHSELLIITEAFSVPHRTLGYDGMYTLQPGDSSRLLFTFQGSVAQAYLDGHVVADSSVDLGYEAIDPYAGTWLVANVPFRTAPWYDMR